MAFGDFKNPGVTAVNDSDSDYVDTQTNEVVPAGATAVWDGDNWDVIIAPATDGIEPLNPIDNQIWVDKSSKPYKTKIWREHINNGSWLTIGVPDSSIINPRGRYVAGTSYSVGDIVSFDGGIYYCTKDTALEPSTTSLSWSTIQPPTEMPSDLQISISNTEFICFADPTTGAYVFSAANSVNISVARNGSKLDANEALVVGAYSFKCSIDSTFGLTAGALTKGTNSYILGAPTAISTTATSTVTLKVIVRNSENATISTTYHRINYTLIKQGGSGGGTATLPHFTVGTVTEGETSTVTITGTDANPVLNFQLKKGIDGTNVGTNIAIGNVTGGDTAMVTATETSVGHYTLDFVLPRGADSTVPGPASAHFILQPIRAYARISKNRILDLNSFDITYREITGKYNTTQWMNTISPTIHWRARRHKYVNGQYIDQDIDMTAAVGASISVPIDLDTVGVTVTACIGNFPDTVGSVNDTIASIYLPVVSDGKDGVDGVAGKILTYELIGMPNTIDYDDTTNQYVFSSYTVSLNKILNGVVSLENSGVFTIETKTVSDSYSWWDPSYYNVTGTDPDTGAPIWGYGGFRWNTYTSGGIIAQGGNASQSFNTSNIIEWVKVSYKIGGVVVFEKQYSINHINKPGIKGEKGDPGVSPVITIGEVRTLAPGQNAYVSYSGTLANPVYNFGIPKGDVGRAARVMIGNVAQANAPSVTNSGTDTDAILNFTIPRGDNGTRNASLVLFKWGLEKPTSKPNGSSIYTWSTGEFTAPSYMNGWSSEIPAAAGGETLWVCRLTIINNSNTDTDVANWNNSKVFAAGASGPNAYIWVKYADTDAGAGMSDSPANKYYMGLAFNKTTAVASTTASDYKWLQVRGIDGISTTVNTITSTCNAISRSSTNVNTPSTISFNAYKRTGVGAIIADDSTYWKLYIDNAETSVDNLVSRSDGIKSIAGSRLTASTTNALVSIRVETFKDAAKTILLAEYSIGVFFAGPKGDKGDTGTIESVTVATLPAGSNAEVSYSGPASNRTIAFRIPRGEIGPMLDIGIGTVTKGDTAAASFTTINPTLKGLNLVLPKGDKGDAGTIDTVTVTAGDVGTDPTVTLGGTPSSRTIAFKIPKGDKGDTAEVAIGTVTTSPSGGDAKATRNIALSTPVKSVIDFEFPRGEKGEAGTLVINSVETGLPGTNATITNIGTLDSAVLNITIPRGDVGPVAAFKIGTVTVNQTGNATATITGTAANPVLNLTVPKGDQGDIGPSLYITSNRDLIFTSVDGGLESTNTDIVFTAVATGIDSTTYNWTASNTATTPIYSNTDTFTITPANFGNSKSMHVTCSLGNHKVTMTIYRFERNSAAAGATVGADWPTNVTNKPTSLSAINADEGTLLGLFSVSGNTVTLAANFQSTSNVTAFATSDISLKEDIRPISDPIAKLKMLSGNNFRWKTEYAISQDPLYFRQFDVGVIAQEVRTALPEAVHERPDGYLGVDYSKIIPLLIEVAKEQQKQIEELTNALLNK